MKKVFIGVLTALMLFAFTACEPQTITWPSSKDVSYVEITQTADYIYGETATKDGFTVIIHYTDSTTEEVVGAVSVTDDVVTSQFDYEGAPVIGATTVARKTVTGATITGVTSATIEDDVTLADLKDITAAIKAETLSVEGTPVITLAYEDGSKQYTLDDLADGKFDVVLSLYKGATMADGTTDFKADETYTVTLDKYKIGTGEWITLAKPAETGLSINVVEAEEPASATIESLEVLYSVTGSRYVEGELTANSKVLTAGTFDALRAVDLFVGDSVTYTVSAVYSDSTEEEPHKTTLTYNASISTKDSYQIVSSSENFADGTQTVKAAQQTASIRYYDVTTGETLTANITIPVGEATVVVSADASVEVVQDKEVNIAENATVNEGNIKTYVNVTGLEVVGRESSTITDNDFDILLPYGNVTVSKEGSDIQAVVKYESYGVTVRVPVVIEDFAPVSGN